MVIVASKMVPTPVDILGNDIPQGTAGYTRDGVSERLSYCLEMVYRAMTRWRNKVRANVDCPLLRLWSNTKLGPVAFVGLSWGLR